MKIKFYASVFASFICASCFSQTDVSSIEDVILPPDSFYDGSIGGNGFQSANIFYNTYYDTNWSYWAGGFAASNKTDSVTSGYLNPYSAKTAGGYASSNYAVGQNNSTLKLTMSSAGDSVIGFYVTNTTYAYNSMHDGDGFAKKFGGTSGNDPDWFKLTVRKYYGGVLTNDSVNFYLADFRFNNNSSDYILKSWQWVNCKPLGKADSLMFVLTSSDVGSFGMNTPAFFAIDNLTTKASVIGMNENSILNLDAYPSPTSGTITIANPVIGKKADCSIFDIQGRMIFSREISFADKLNLDLSNFENGLYVLKVTSDGKIYEARIVKQ